MIDWFKLKIWFGWQSGSSWIDFQSIWTKRNWKPFSDWFGCRFWNIVQIGSKWSIDWFEMKYPIRNFHFLLRLAVDVDVGTFKMDIFHSVTVVGRVRLNWTRWVKNMDEHEMKPKHAWRRKRIIMIWWKPGRCAVQSVRSSDVNRSACGHEKGVPGQRGQVVSVRTGSGEGAVCGRIRGPSLVRHPGGMVLWATILFLQGAGLVGKTTISLNLFSFASLLQNLLA